MVYAPLREGFRFTVKALSIYTYMVQVIVFLETVQISDGHLARLCLWKGHRGTSQRLCAFLELDVGLVSLFSDGNITRVSRNLAFAQRRKGAISGHTLLICLCLEQIRVEEKNLRSTLVRA